MKPVIPYHGGKGRLASWIVSLMPEHRVYLEPFAGSAAVLLAKPQSTHEICVDALGRPTDCRWKPRNPDRYGGLRQQHLQHLAELIDVEYAAPIAAQQVLAGLHDLIEDWSQPIAPLGPQAHALLAEIRCVAELMPKQPALFEDEPA